MFQGLVLSRSVMLLLEVATTEFAGRTHERPFFRAIDREWMPKAAHSYCYFLAVKGLLSRGNLRVGSQTYPPNPSPSSFCFALLCLFHLQIPLPLNYKSYVLTITGTELKISSSMTG